MDTYGMSIDGTVYKTYLWKCTTCPFETSDRDAFFSHSDGIPGGWLGRNETHTMAVHPDVIRYSDVMRDMYVPMKGGVA